MWMPTWNSCLLIIVSWIVFQSIAADIPSGKCHDQYLNAEILPNSIQPTLLPLERKEGTFEGLQPSSVAVGAPATLVGACGGVEHDDAAVAVTVGYANFSRTHASRPRRLVSSAKTSSVAMAAVS